MGKNGENYCGKQIFIVEKEIAYEGKQPVRGILHLIQGYKETIPSPYMYPKLLMPSRRNFYRIIGTIVRFRNTQNL